LFDVFDCYFDGFRGQTLTQEMAEDIFIGHLQLRPQDPLNPLLPTGKHLFITFYTL
jgi:hypothetical protein